MTSAYLVGGGLLIIAFTIWLLVRNAKKQGASEQLAKDARLQSDAESEIHQVQARRVDTPETIKRMEDGTY